MSEKIRWYNNGIKEIQVKESQKIPDGFIKGRLKKETRVDILCKQISKEELYDKYIIQNLPYHKLKISFDIELTDKDVRRLLTKYGIKKNLKNAAKNNPHNRTHESYVQGGKKSSETQKKNWNNKSDEEKQQWAEKCRQAQLNMPQEVKDKKSKGYTNWYNSLSDEEKTSFNKQKSETAKKTWSENKSEILEKMHKSYKENKRNRLCRTIAEQKMYDCLIEKFIDLQYDVRVDDRYPYYCDFYIPSEDLFIELNAHPSHGRLPFQYLLFEEYSKYPNKWVDVFAKRDVEKQSIAKNNGLNYVMIYPNATLDENLKINNNHYLVEILYNSQS